MLVDLGACCLTRIGRSKKQANNEHWFPKSFSRGSFSGSIFLGGAAVLSARVCM